MVFILYRLYVLLPYTYPTPKLSPHRRRCISTSPPKNSLCMIYKHFELSGHWKCPHKSPSPCNTCVIIQMCPHKPHTQARTHSRMHARTHTHTHYIAKSTGTTPSLEEKRVLPKCGNKDENIIKVLKNSIFTSVATVLKCMKWLYQYVQVIGVWWWILGSRSAFKVTPEVFSWD